MASKMSKGPPPPPRPSLLEALLAVLVVDPRFSGSDRDLVRAGDLLELSRHALVGVVLDGRLAVRLLDLRRVRGLGDAEDVVKHGVVACAMDGGGARANANGHQGRGGWRGDEAAGDDRSDGDEMAGRASSRRDGSFDPGRGRGARATQRANAREGACGRTRVRRIDAGARIGRTLGGRMPPKCMGGMSTISLFGGESRRTAPAPRGYRSRVRREVDLSVEPRGMRRVSDAACAARRCARVEAMCRAVTTEPPLGRAGAQDPIDLSARTAAPTRDFSEAFFRGWRSAADPSHARTVTKLCSYSL